MFSREEFQEYLNTDSIKRKAELEEQLTNHMWDVMQKIYLHYDQTLYAFWFDGAEEGEVGPVGKYIRYCSEPEDVIGGIMVMPEKEKISTEFYFKWIFMSPDEVVNDILTEERKSEEKKKRLRLTSAEKLLLVRSALLKLTEEERRAVGFTKKESEKIIKSVSI